jgi:exonuclease SbcC
MNILKSAELKNFRGYGDRNNTVQFGPGVNLILGDNATGKSSIVTLILFDLLNKKIDVAKYEDYRTIEPKDISVYRAGLTLVGTDNKEYSIYKSFDGRAVKTTIRCDGTELRKAGELELSRRDEAQSFILQKFGATQEMLEYLLVQMQDPAKLLWPVGEAKEVGSTLSKLLRFEPLQNVFANAKSCQRMLLDEATAFLSELEDIKKQIRQLKLQAPKSYERKVQKLHNRKEIWERKANDISSEISKLKLIRNEKDKELSKLQKEQGSKERLSEVIAKAKTELKGQRKPKETVAEIAAKRQLLSQRLQGLGDKLEYTTNRIGILGGTKTKAEKESRKLAALIQALSKEYASLVEALKENGVDIEPKTRPEAKKLRRVLQKQSQSLTDKLGGLKEKVTAEKEYVEILSQATANCPVCDNRLTPRQRAKIIQQKSSIITKAKREIEQKRKAEKDASEAVKILERVEQLLKEIAEHSNRLNREEKGTKAAEKALAPLTKRQENIKAKQNKLRQKIEELVQRAKVAKEFRDLNEWIEKLKESKKALLALPKVQYLVNSYDNKLEKLATRQSDIKSKLGALEPEIQRIRQDLANAKVWYDKLDLAKKKTKVAHGYADEMGLASDAAKAALHELFKSYTDMVNFSLRWIWPSLYPRSDLRQIELVAKVEEADDRGEKTIVTETTLTRLGADGQRIPFNTISSHGQRVLASIAFRVAFLNLLWRTSVPRILVLDEPTIWIDNQNRERLGQLLANLVKEVKEGGIKLEQIIVISHDPAFLNAIDPEGVKHICIKNEKGFCEVSSPSS